MTDQTPTTTRTEAADLPDTRTLHLQPELEHGEEKDWVGYLNVTLTGNVEVRVRATNAAKARALIEAQMNERQSDATDAIAEHFGRMIRTETLDYTLDVEHDPDPDGNDDSDDEDDSDD